MHFYQVPTTKCFTFLHPILTSIRKRNTIPIPQDHHIWEVRVVFRLSILSSRLRRYDSAGMYVWRLTRWLSPHHLLHHASPLHPVATPRSHTHCPHNYPASTSPSEHGTVLSRGIMPYVKSRPSSRRHLALHASLLHSVAIPRSHIHCLHLGLNNNVLIEHNAVLVCWSSHPRSHGRPHNNISCIS